jgi:hypothetical protein
MQRLREFLAFTGFLGDECVVLATEAGFRVRRSGNREEMLA